MTSSLPKFYFYGTSFAFFFLNTSLTILLLVLLLQNSRKSEKNGRLARRRKRTSARLQRIESVLPLRQTSNRLKVPLQLIHHKPLNLLHTLPVSVRNCLRSDTSLQMVKCQASTAPRLVVAWSTLKVMARSPILPTTHTHPMDKQTPSINHVSKVASIAFVYHRPPLSQKRFEGVWTGKLLHRMDIRNIVSHGMVVLTADPLAPDNQPSNHYQ